MSGLGFLDAAARQAQSLADRSRRPWPLPAAPWARAETREHAVLAHWRSAPPALERLVAPGLELETFGGEAWLSAVAYRIDSLRLRGLPPLPGLSSLLALEVRTYVTDGERPGIWLLSLDVTSRVFVEAAKRTHRLPAYHAQIALERAGARRRLEVSRGGLGLRAAFRTRGRLRVLEPGTLDHFLCERYAVYTSDGGRLYRAELHHSPWRLREADAELEDATLAGVEPAAVAHAGAAERQDVLVWPLEEL